MNKEVIREVENYFSMYYDQEYIKNEIINNYTNIEKQYKNDDEISLEVYMTAMLKNTLLIGIINRVKEKDDIESEIFMIDKYSFVHDLYVRRNQIESNFNLYEKAISEAIVTYDKHSSFTSYLYKVICKQYELHKGKSLKKEL